MFNCQSDSGSGVPQQQAQQAPPPGGPAPAPRSDRGSKPRAIDLMLENLKRYGSALVQGSIAAAAPAQQRGQQQQLWLGFPISFLAWAHRTYGSIILGMRTSQGGIGILDAVHEPECTAGFC